MRRARLPFVAASTLPSGRFLKVFVTGAALSLRMMVNCWSGVRFVRAVSFKLAFPRTGALLVMIARPSGGLGGEAVLRGVGGEATVKSLVLSLESGKPPLRLIELWLS